MHFEGADAHLGDPNEKFGGAKRGRLGPSRGTEGASREKEGASGGFEGAKKKEEGANGSLFRAKPLPLPVSGTILPNMGTEPSSSTRLADVLFSPVQQRVLALLFGQPGRSFQSAEVIALAGSGTGAVHRQLVRLAESGLVTVTRVGNQKHYQANPDSPVFSELHGLVVKTMGLAGPLQEALASFRERVQAAFVYGSIAKGTDTAQSDIDLMVLGDDLAYPDLYSALQEAEATLRRPVHVSLMTPAEWKRKLAAGNPFVTKVQSQPKVPLIGSADDLT